MVDLEAPKSSQETPKSSQTEPKRAPKTLSKPFLDYSFFFKMLRFPCGKSRSLRLGGFAWEFNIDPKRLRKKIKHDIEHRRTKISENKSTGNYKKSPKKL